MKHSQSKFKSEKEITKIKHQMNEFTLKFYDLNLKKAKAYNFIKKEALTQALSREF